MGFLLGKVGKVVTAIRHPSLIVEYVRWNVGEMRRRPLLIDGTFGTRLRAPNYHEFRFAHGLIPNSAEVRMIGTLTSNWPLFIDAGANVGGWTVALAAAHPGAHVYCFEPAPNTFKVLCENIRLNRLQNVTAAQLALSDSPGIASFQVTKASPIFNRLAPGKESITNLRRARFRGARTIEVKTIRLEDFCRDSNIERIGFLKIDVEGAEGRLLRGAQRLLRNRAIDLIWIEVASDNLREMGDSVESLARTMQGLGYSFHSLQSDGSPGAAVDILAQHSLNMIAMPE
jgi:FkbM family methyltransferase